MKRKNNNVDQRLELQRAMIILYRNVHTVEDLLRYWHYSGPCTEPHPDIEDIS